MHSEDPIAGRRRSVTAARRRRWWVHVALIATAAMSLVLEPLLTLHIVLGLAFVGLVGLHLAQRRRVSISLVGRLGRPRTLLQPGGRLAVADALLTVLTVAMLASGLADGALGHPTRIRWHALTGVALAGFLVVHTMVRRRRLWHSTVR